MTLREVTGPRPDGMCGPGVDGDGEAEQAPTVRPAADPTTYSRNQATYAEHGMAGLVRRATPAGACETGLIGDFHPRHRPAIGARTLTERLLKVVRYGQRTARNPVHNFGSNASPPGSAPCPGTLSRLAPASVPQAGEAPYIRSTAQVRAPRPRITTLADRA